MRWRTFIAALTVGLTILALIATVSISKQQHTPSQSSTCPTRDAFDSARWVVSSEKGWKAHCAVLAAQRQIVAVITGVMAAAAAQQVVDFVADRH